MKKLGTTALALLLCLGLCAPASAAPIPTRLSYSPAEIVPIPASIPHEEGDMIDRRILPNLRWIAQRFPIFITDGYSGNLPDSDEKVGCDGCHTNGSDHHNGLAVDIAAPSGATSCDASWAPLTRLARWAEPLQGKPRAPFRWVGYDGDSGHGCGHHLHLSWEHAETNEFELAEWVEVFALGNQSLISRSKSAPRGGSTPKGGFSAVQQGGVSPSS